MEPVAIAVVIFIALVGATIAIRSLWKEVVVDPNTVTLVYDHGKIVRRLEAGRHLIFGKEPVFVRVDPRPLWIHVAGQELLTTDGAPVRVSVSCRLGVADLERFAAARDPLADMYARIQLDLRDSVVGRTMNALIEERDAIDAQMRERVEVAAASLGMTVEQCAIRDIGFMGETKRAYADLINAQLKARATLERARGEAAAMRSMLNTVELVRKNPELIHLRALQGMDQGLASVQIRIGEASSKPAQSG